LRVIKLIMTPVGLKRAINLIHSGQKDQAQKLLIQLLQDEPTNEAAWIWLVDTLDSDEERIAGLNHCLKFIPNSQIAHQALSSLTNLPSPIPVLPQDHQKGLSTRDDLTQKSPEETQAIQTSVLGDPIQSPTGLAHTQSSIESTQPLRPRQDEQQIPRQTSAHMSSADHLRGQTENSLSSRISLIGSAALRQMARSLTILLSIALLTRFGLYMADFGRKGLPTTPIDAAVSTVIQTFNYILHHPPTYIWHKYEVPVFELVSSLFIRSAGLLLLSLLIATLAGGVLGITTAQIRQRNIKPMVLLASILGVSTPSFLLAMLFWVLNLKLARLFSLNPAPFPPTGFGWDNHLVMPALVLATRPLAQVMQVTYINLSEILDQDFMRAAKARGLSQHKMIFRHAIPNLMIPILTTLGTSLRFSLASLPVVESFFLWEGIGLALLQAINLDMPSMVTDLILSLGLLFIVINLILDIIYPLLDSRLRKEAVTEDREEKLALADRWIILRDSFIFWGNGITRSFTSQRKKRGKDRTARAGHSTKKNSPDTGWTTTGIESPRISKPRYLITSTLRNFPFIIGTLLLLTLISLSFFGSQISNASPYETHGVTIVDGEIMTPPFEPSELFPWGSDIIGRDIQALVLSGARMTLSLALFGMLTRIGLGVGIGMLAGWWQRSWLDKLVNSLIAVWAAFPATLFAMILILGMGIQRGMSVFVITLCVIGWGEIAQYVRGLVISEKPKLYIEATRSLGANTIGILRRHIFPNLIPSILVLSVLEMGAILMLLAELGFLNIFLGGGFKVQIGEVGRMVPVIFYFSDVPEWGALLSNIRDWWRSYPWLAWYPGVFFFVSILTFNLWGEGLRRFLDESKINLRWMFSRYTLLAGIVALTAAVLLFRSNTPLELYRSQAKNFESSRVMQHIQVLTADEMQGRKAGTDAAQMAANYIADEMEKIGLFPGGEKETYIQTQPVSRFNLSAEPRLEILDETNTGAYIAGYRKDFVEYTNAGAPYYQAYQGQVVGLAVRPETESTEDTNIILTGEVYDDKVFILYQDALKSVHFERPSGILVIMEDPDILNQRYLYPSVGYRNRRTPMYYITPELADYLLAPVGSGAEILKQKVASLSPGTASMTAAGATLRMVVEGSSEDAGEPYHNVIGYIPGIGAELDQPGGTNMDSYVIIISAYYDGVGIGPDGTFYPGANDNASAVATMLEIARVMQEGNFQPKKTVVFTAWSGGERGEGYSVQSTMNAKTGFNQLTVESVIELSGLGAGSGEDLLLQPGSSYRLVSLFQDAAGRVGLSTTTRGRDPHFDRPVQSAFGNRTAMSLYLAWDGSDQFAHSPNDTLEIINPQNIQKVGEAATLTLTVLSREVEY
jgi:ABC-type dipeptide/oligopeptide/nickel transport system permease component